MIARAGKSLSLLAGMTMIAGCTTAAEPNEIPVRGSTAGYVCNAEKLQEAVGDVLTPQLGQNLFAESGARYLRWSPPRSAVTMDYREDRLTVAYDDDWRITTIRCG